MIYLFKKYIYIYIFYILMENYDLNTILLKISNISTKCMHYFDISYIDDNKYFNDINNVYHFLNPFSIAYLFSTANENNNLFENFEDELTICDKEKIKMLSLTEDSKKEFINKIKDIFNIYTNIDSNIFQDIGILDYHNKNKNKIINILNYLLEI